jgi:hypothetical protein
MPPRAFLSSPHFVAVLLCLILALPARAHHGFESTVEVRLLDDQTFAVVRMSASVTSALLGEGAPTAWDDAVAAEEQPRLRALAPSLLGIEAGKIPLAPTSTKVVLEVSGQLAFVVTYPPARSWPVTAEAAYFRNFGPEFTGTLRVYGPPRQPTERCGAQLAALELFSDRRSLQIPQP